MKRSHAYPIIAACVIAITVLGLWMENDRKAAAQQAENDRKAAAIQEARDWYIVRSVLASTMAVATNNILDAEPGSLLDCIDATCRVTAPDHGRGTGVVFRILEDGRIHVMTNAHVATGTNMKLEFWEDGHLMNAVSGKTILRDVGRDVAVIEVQRSEFGKYPPTVIPLAARGTELKNGQEIISAGCPRAEWTKAWIGHVENTKDGRVAFQPGPVGGQSGSAIFNADGTEIVALLNLQESNASGRILRGYAVSLESIYQALDGKKVDASVNYWNRQRGWPYSEQPSQCGPRGCPNKRKSEPAPPLVPPEIVPEIVPEIIPEDLDVSDSRHQQVRRLLVPDLEPLYADGRNPTQEDIKEANDASDSADRPLSDIAKFVLIWFPVILAVLFLLVSAIIIFRSGPTKGSLGE